MGKCREDKEIQERPPSLGAEPESDLHRRSPVSLVHWIG